jgi:transcriptional regulator with XRE-family HTH domain
LRRGLGLSQEELAARAGLHWTCVSDLERGQQTPTLDVVIRLARALGVTLAMFFAPLDPALPGSPSEAAQGRIPGEALTGTELAWSTRRDSKPAASRTCTDHVASSTASA